MRYKQLLERLTANDEVSTVQGTIPPSSDTVESKGRQMKLRWIKYLKSRQKTSPFYFDSPNLFAAEWRRL